MLLSPIYSYSKPFPEKSTIDTTYYITYTDPEESISFNYPIDWNIMYYSAVYVKFKATEKLTDPSDAYMENVIYGKIGKIDNLSTFLKTRFKGIKAHTKNKIEFVGKEFKTNKNGIDYAALIISSKEKRVVKLETHVYFIKGNYSFNLIFRNDSIESTRYNEIFNNIIQSIKFLN